MKGIEEVIGTERAIEREKGRQEKGGGNN